LMLMSRLSAIRSSVHASPASEASAFSRIRARSSLRAECLPLRIVVCRCSRSSPLSLTIYLLTALCFPDTKSTPKQ
jgi:hypothetical protein